MQLMRLTKCCQIEKLCSNRITSRPVTIGDKVRPCKIDRQSIVLSCKLSVTQIRELRNRFFLVRSLSIFMVDFYEGQLRGKEKQNEKEKIGNKGIAV